MQHSVSFNLLALDIRHPIGVERFCRDVISGVQLPDSRITCYTRNGIPALTDLLKQTFLNNHPQVTQKNLWVGSTITRILVEMLVVPFFTCRDDVVVSVNNFGPVWGKKNQSRLVIVHDIWFLSEFYEGGRAKKWLFSWLLRFQLGQSSKVITVSDFSRREISRYIGVPTNEIDLVSPCIGREIPLASVSTIKDREFLLLVGSERKNKNILRAIKGFQIFLGNNPDSSITMTVVGKYSDEFIEFVKQSYSSIWNHLDFQGFVDDAALDQLYRNCRGVVFPSLYEGFGIPAVESLMYGRPVLVAQNTACSEIVAGFSICVDARNPSAIGSGIEELLKTTIDISSKSFRMFHEECMNCNKQSMALTTSIQQSSKST